MTDTPKTLAEAVVYYRDPQVCIEEMIRAKWPDGKITCPKCGGSKIGRMATRPQFFCDCGKQFTATSGTLLDRTRRLDLLLVAVWCEVSGVAVSAAAIGTLVGVEKKTAWSVRRMVDSVSEKSSVTKLLRSLLKMQKRKAKKRAAQRKK